MDRRRCCRHLGGLGLLAGAWPWKRLHAAQRRVVVRVQTDLAWRGLPLRLAERLGHCAQEGLSLQWVPDLPEEADADDAVGPLVHVLSFDRLVRRVLSGADLRWCATLVRTPQLAIAVSTQAGALRPESWREARIGVPQGQDVIARLAGWILTQGWGAAPAQWWPLQGAAAAEQALSRGTVQLLVWGDPLLTRLERDGSLRLLVDLRHPQQAQRWLGAPLLCAGVAAPAAQFEAHGQTLRQLVRALQRTLQWLHGASALDLAAHADLAAMEHDRALFLRVLERLRASYATEAAVEPAAVQQALRLLASLPGGVVYQAADAARLLPPRGWSAS